MEHIQDVSSADPKATSDRRDLIEMWFDTTNAGVKTERGSYVKIAEGLGRSLGSVLFLSDSVGEVKAAREAGMRGIVVCRPGNAELAEGEREAFDVVTSFEQIEL